MPTIRIENGTEIFYKDWGDRDLALPLYGANRSGARVSEGVLETFLRRSMQAGYAAAYDCIKAFSETDFTEDLRKMELPTPFIHGDDDQIVPLADPSQRPLKVVRNGAPRVYQGAPQGLFVTNRDQLHRDLLEFAKS